MTKTPRQCVFISHNQADKDIARELAMFLTSDNVGVWFDEWELSPGDSIVNGVSAGLNDCTHGLLLWSANASRSRWVEREVSSSIGKALQTGVPRIIPVILDDTPVPRLADRTLWLPPLQDELRPITSLGRL